MCARRSSRRPRCPRPGRPRRGSSSRRCPAAWAWAAGSSGWVGPAGWAWVLRRRGGAGPLRALAAALRQDRGVESLRIQVLADAVQRLRRVTRRELVQLEVDRVARTDLDQALVDAGEEVVQRARRRPADDR